MNLRFGMMPTRKTAFRSSLIRFESTCVIHFIENCPPWSSIIDFISRLSSNFLTVDERCLSISAWMMSMMLMCWKPKQLVMFSMMAPLRDPGPPKMKIVTGQVLRGSTRDPIRTLTRRLRSKTTNFRFLDFSSFVRRSFDGSPRSRRSSCRPNISKRSVIDQ